MRNKRDLLKYGPNRMQNERDNILWACEVMDTIVWKSVQFERLSRGRLYVSYCYIYAPSFKR
jgi:hypothetical protein